MKIKFKSKVDIELEVQKTSKKKKTEKSNSILKKLAIWLIGAIASALVGELVTWIIKLFTNGSFYYFSRRLFLFQEVKYG